MPEAVAMLGQANHIHNHNRDPLKPFENMLSWTFQLAKKSSRFGFKVVLVLSLFCVILRTFVVVCLFLACVLR